MSFGFVCLLLYLLTYSFNVLLFKLKLWSSPKVHVLDINDNCPKIDGPLFLTGVISEGARPGSLVMSDSTSFTTPTPLRIPVSDPDTGLAGEVSYHLIDNTSSLFSVEPHSGRLRLIGELDREEREEYLLTIAVMDGGLRSGDAWARVRIRVTDVNNSPPEFIAPLPSVATVNLPTFEHALVAKFRARDPDVNDTVTFSSCHVFIVLS